jgi:hypothetical protein
LSQATAAIRFPGDDRATLTNMREILGPSQRNNKRDDITGFLIFDKTWFVQVLEGEKAKVKETYDSPRSATRRHCRHEHARHPDAFLPDLSMGGALRSPEVQEIYLENGIGGDLDPAKLKGEQILQLALTFRLLEQAKRQGIKAAS